jgi:hypothetical protein
MSDQELERLEVLQDLDRGRLTTAAAGQLLGLERRQVFRLLKAYRIEGPPGLISKRRGRRSNRRKPGGWPAQETRHLKLVSSAGEIMQDRSQPGDKGFRSMQAGRVFPLPPDQPTRLVSAQAPYRACGAAAPAFVATDFLAGLAERARSRYEQIGLAADFAIVHCFSELVAAAGKSRKVGCASRHRARATRALPIAAFPWSLMARCRPSGIDPGQSAVPRSGRDRCRPAFRPEKPRTRAPSRNPCGFKSRSRRR